MEQIKDAMKMLDLVTRPAFCVREGVIVYVNQPAQSHTICVGTSVATMLPTAAQEYADFTGGCLYLTLEISGQVWGASVTRMGQFDAFLMEEENEPELRAMALASQELRAPLARVMTQADRLFPALSQESPAIQEQAARINRGLFQLLRIVCNMSDVSRYATSMPRPEAQEIRSRMEEIFAKAATLTQYAGVDLQYTGLTEDLFCLVDVEKLERAIYNILSNSLKFTPAGGIIRASFTRRGGKLYLSIWDNGPGVAEDIRSSVFSRFLREPGLEDGRYGIGLGMAMVRTVATVHGGAVLMEQPKEGGTRITMTMEIRKRTSNRLHSPMLQVDYAGERDHGLIELSDALPYSLFEREKIN